ncbi:MAG: dinitrogenase iron-molybdenum cofactor biosynthesis protein [Candidatus Aminicenantes bacterium]|nr:MAG: dinitrogenase iron-molybdenum cofactor biosynthesis protein [Candidatus Aminicenantes bacterium]
MKIVVSASNPELSSPVDPRFGRCAYFLFVDSETMKFEAAENPNISSTSGAGIQSAQFVSNKGANVLLTGSCGPNAFQTLQAAGVEVIVGVMGTVQEAVQQYKSGQLQAVAQPNVPAHSGMGMGGSPPIGPGSGMGGGMGRGMGGGMGRGMGGGMGRGMGYNPAFQTSGMPPSSPSMSQLSPEEELQYLKQQAEYLRQQTENISKRITELEKKK